MNSEHDDADSPPVDPDLTGPDGEPVDISYFTLIAGAFEGGLVFVAWGVGWLIGYPPLETLSWSAGDFLIGLLATTPLVVGLVLINRYPIGPLAGLKRVVHDLIVPLFKGTSIPEFAAIAALAGLGEELLFRGLLQGALAGWLSSHIDPQAAVLIALITASLVFGLLHFITPMYAILCVLVGIYLGGLWIWTGNLLVPIVVHALYDFVALVYLVRSSGPPRTSSCG